MEQLAVIKIVDCILEKMNNNFILNHIEKLESISPRIILFTYLSTQIPTKQRCALFKLYSKFPWALPVFRYRPLGKKLIDLCSFDFSYVHWTSFHTCFSVSGQDLYLSFVRLVIIIFLQLMGQFVLPPVIRRWGSSNFLLLYVILSTFMKTSF